MKPGLDSRFLVPPEATYGAHQRQTSRVREDNDDDEPGPSGASRSQLPHTGSRSRMASARVKSLLAHGLEHVAQRLHAHPHSRSPWWEDEEREEKEDWISRSDEPAGKRVSHDSLYPMRRNAVSHSLPEGIHRREASKHTRMGPHVPASHHAGEFPHSHKRESRLAGTLSRLWKTKRKDQSRSTDSSESDSDDERSPGRPRRHPASRSLDHLRDLDPDRTTMDLAALSTTVVAHSGKTFTASNNDMGGDPFDTSTNLFDINMGPFDDRQVGVSIEGIKAKVWAHLGPVQDARDSVATLRASVQSCNDKDLVQSETCRQDIRISKRCHRPSVLVALDIADSMESGSEHLSSRDTEPFDEAESESPVLDIDRLIEGALVRQLSRRVESALELFPPLSHDAEAETDTRLHEDPTMRQSTSTLPSRMAGRVSGNLRPVPFRPSHPLEREDVEPCDDFEIEEYFRQHRSFQRGKTRKQPQDPWWFGSSSCGEGGLSSVPRLDEWPPMMSGDVRPSIATEETSTVDNVNPGCLLDEVAANTATTASASPSDFDHPGKIRDDQAEEEAVGAAQLRAVIAAAEALGYGSTSVCATSPVPDAGSPTSLLEPQSAERQFQAVVAAANDVLRERERELASHRRSNALPSFGYFAGLIWNAMPHLFLEPGLWPSMSIGSNSTSPKHETGLHGRPSVLSSREPIHGGEGEPARRTVSVRQAARASTSTRPGQVAHTDSTHRWTAPERRGVGPEPDGLEMRPMVRGHYIPSDRAPPDDPDPSLGLVPYPPPPPPPLVFAPPTVTSNQARDWDWWQERAAGVAEVTKDVWTAEVCAQRLRADVGSRDAQADSDGTCELPKPKTADPADDSTRTRENDQPRQDRGCRNRLFDDDNLGLPQDEYIHQTTSRGQRDLAILLDQRDEPEQQQPGTPRMHWMD